MNEQTMISNLPANGEAVPQPWVTPTFERTELKEAMSGSGGPSYTDGVTYNS